MSKTKKGGIALLVVFGGLVIIGAMTPKAEVSETPVTSPVTTPVAPSEVTEPDAESSDLMRWLAFTEEATPYNTEVENAMNDVAEAADEGDIDVTVDEASKARRVIGRYLTYLDANPPAECYKPVWDGLHGGLIRIDLGLLLFVETDDIDEAVESIESGNALITAATPLIERVDCAG